MQHPEQTKETLIIYSNNQIHLNFFDPALETLRPLHIVKKPLSELSSSSKNHVSILMINTLADLAFITPDFNQIVITDNTLINISAHLPNAIIYHRQPHENQQQALEKIFHGLVKFCFSTSMLLDLTDIHQCSSFAKGQHDIHLHDLTEGQFSDNNSLKTLLASIDQDDTVIVNFSLTPAYFSIKKFSDLSEMITEQLVENFDGEIICSGITSSSYEQHNRIYLSYFS